MGGQQRCFSTVGNQHVRSETLKTKNMLCSDVKPKKERCCFWLRYCALSMLTSGQKSISEHLELSWVHPL